MKKLFLTLATAIWSLVFVATSGTAAPLTATDQAALDTRISSFSQSFESGNLSKVVEIIPPKILAVMSKQFGVSAPELLDGMALAMEQAMQNVTIDTYRMDQNNATTAETSSGRTYLLIPTETVMTIEESTQIKSMDQTLAFEDEGVWYLVRIDDAQQVQFLTQAYPEFSGIDFPAGTVAVVSK